LLFSVDTCAGEPVSGLDATAFEISEDGRPISSYESKRTIRAKGQRYRMSSLLLLDLSGSVLESGQFPALKEAAERYVQTVLVNAGEGQRVGVMTFDGREKPELLVEFTDDQAKLLAGLATLERRECSADAECAGFPDRRTCSAWRCVDDSTNLNGAIVQALDTLDSQFTLEPGISWRDASLVVFTDGTDQSARVSQMKALERTRTARPHLFTVGLGGEVDEQALRSFGKDGYFAAAQPDQLASSFETIARRITGMANRFYLLEYCSPKRNGKHSLKISATIEQPNGLPLAGSLSGDFDATGFTSGCAVEP
jgi:hypothetical protein